MAKVFTQEEREKIKWQVVELVRQSGRETLRQLEAKTGATRYLMSVLARELVASGDVYNSGYGLYVIINHGNGRKTLYGHTSKLLVQAGEKVFKGQPIALVGNTGNSFGAHLHFEVIENGTHVDPLNYVTP